MTGKYDESLNDAKASTDLQPNFLKAIVRGRGVLFFVQKNDINCVAVKGDREVTPLSHISAVSEKWDTKHSS